MIEKSNLLFDLAESKEENPEIRKRIMKERLSVEYIVTACIEDGLQRCDAVDTFAEKVKEFKLTEIMERCNMYDSFEYMKRERFAKNRNGRYNMYYVVK